LGHTDFKVAIRLSQKYTKIGLLPYIHVNAAILLLPGEIITAISLCVMRNNTCPAWLTSLPVAVKIINLNLLG